jgi:phosphatidylglycerol:prolipoprotein diacylglycerol transferase
VLPILPLGGHFPIYSYGVFTTVGFLLAILWPAYLAGKEGISAAKMEGLGLVIVFTAGLGSKLLTALDYPGFYSGGWNHFLFDQVLGRGGVFYGGFLFAVAGSAIYCRVVGLPGWQTADCVAPGLALAQGLGRVGCFLAGCCWGTPTQFRLGVTFTSDLAHSITGVRLHVRLHPTQLYESALVLLSIPFLMWLRKGKSFQGEVILAYVLYYAVARFFLEFFRGDPRGYYFNDLLSTSQLISLLIVPPVTIFMVRMRKQAAIARQGDRKTPPVLVLTKARAKAI